MPPGRLVSGSLYLTRPTLNHYATEREELLSRARDVFGWIADGKVDVRIGGRYPFDQARQAQADLEARRSTGKLLVALG
jgi:NADPH2:quinone reductase